MTQTNRLRYTLGFIHCPETKQVLLLNRNKSPWMGKWNGVGGKLDHNETPLACIIRETFEETGLHLPQYESRGILLWEVSNSKDKQSEEEPHMGLGGLYIFTATITKSELDQYKTPISYCKEGILDWKSLDWILHEENLGIVDNIQIIFKNLFNANDQDLFSTKYHDNKLIKCEYIRDGNKDYPI